MKALAALFAFGILSAQGADWVQSHYAKREAMIPMRDGVELYTAIYEPRNPAGPLPFLLNRTCYGSQPYGAQAYPDELGPADALARDGFIFVYQDVRGRMMSQGDFIEVTPHLGGRGVDESTDAYDTIDWLLKNVPGNNGRVGAWGISYPGYYAASTLVRPHPALKAVSPQAPMVDLFDGDDDHHNGALFLSQTFWFDAAFARQRKGPTSTWDWNPGFFPAHGDGYRFFLEMGALPHADERYLKGGVRTWLDEMAHGARDGYWKARDLRPHIQAPAPAVLTVGGWFDAEDLFGALQLDRRLGSTGGPRTLVMGPWIHGGWERTEGSRLGRVEFGSDTSAWFQDLVETPFFLHHLKDAPDPLLPRAFVFETGRNLWHRFDAWPPPQARPVRMYFRAGGALATDAPLDPGGADTYVSDPARPVPYTQETELRVNPDYMVGDQRFAASRPDVLTYRTPPLEKDLTVAGPIQVRLQVSTTGTDADWVVKVIDVYPDDFGADTATPTGWGPPVNVLGGYQQLLRGDVMRGKFRNSFEAPEPFAPGAPAAVNFTLNDVFHTFRKGHRLMVQVQSSWFPLVDRNPQVFEDIYRAKDDDFRKASQTVHRSPALPSCLVLPVLDAAQ